MKIYFTGTDGTRRLQECNVSESVVPEYIGTDGTADYKMYRLYNETEGEKELIIFGGKERIAENLRDNFWLSIKAVYKSGIHLFDVDEWHGKIIFVKPGEIPKKKKEKLRRHKKG